MYKEPQLKTVSKPINADSAASEAKKRIPRAATRLKVCINGKEYTASQWNHVGCRLEGYPQPVEIGNRLFIELHFCGISSDSRVKCEGEIVWKYGDHIGIKFNSLPLYEETLVTHQLREALKLVGKKKEDFHANYHPTETVELENVKHVSRTEAAFSRFSHFLIKATSLRAVGIITMGLTALIFIAYLATSGKVRGRGTVISDVEVIPATENGTLVKLVVTEGDTVKKGAKLFMTRDEDFYKEEVSRLAQLRRDLQEAESRYRIAKNGQNPATANYQSLRQQRDVQLNIYKSYEKLYKLGAIPREALLEKEKELIKLSGELSVAQANEKLINPYAEHYNIARLQMSPLSSEHLSNQKSSSMQNNLIYKWYFSPSDATVLKLPRLSGSTLTRGSTLAVLQPLDATPRIRMFLPHDTANQLQIGNHARINIAGMDQELNGVVVGIDKRGGLDLNIFENRVDNLFENNSSLAETPSEILIRITDDKLTRLPRLSIGAKASVVIDASVENRFLLRLFKPGSKNAT